MRKTTVHWTSRPTISHPYVQRSIVTFFQAASLNSAAGTTSTYTLDSSTPVTTYYRVLVNASNNGCDQVIHAVVTAVIIEDLAITAQPENVIECLGGIDVMTLDVIGGSGTIIYQWQSSPNGTDDWVNATGAGATTSVFIPESTSTGMT